MVDSDIKEDVLCDLIENDCFWMERGCDFGFRDPESDHRAEFTVHDGNGVDRTMAFIVKPLHRMLSESSEEEVINVLRMFRSKTALSFSPVLRIDSIQAEKEGTYRTFLFMTQDDEIIGYVMLGLGTLSVPRSNTFPRSILSALGLSGDSGSVPMFMLAQMSFSFDAPERFGGMMLKVVYEMLSVAKEVVGCRFVSLECDDEQAKSFGDLGFQVFFRRDECISQMVALV